MSSGLHQTPLALSYAALRAIGTIRLTSSSKKLILQTTMSQNNNPQDRSRTGGEDGSKMTPAEFAFALSILDLEVPASMLGRSMVVDLHDEPLRYLASIGISEGWISEGYNAASDSFGVLPSQQSSESALSNFFGVLSSQRSSGSTPSGSVLSNCRTGRRTEPSPDSSNFNTNNPENSANSDSNNNPESGSYDGPNEDV